MAIFQEEPKKDLVEGAVKIVEKAKERGIVTRAMGACAVRLHCPEFQYLFDSLGRELTDIDIVTYAKYRGGLGDLLVELGYLPDERYIALYGERRLVYYHGNKRSKVDIFVDKLEMCHTIDFKGRLELDFPTITLADMFLEKMQIVEINEKDIKDVIVLLLEHKIAAEDDETINAKYIAKLLARDWGFHHTVTTNLNKVRYFSRRYEVLTDENREHLTSQIFQILEFIEGESKSLGWKLRAKIGVRKKWYQDVE